MVLLAGSGDRVYNDSQQSVFLVFITWEYMKSTAYSILLAQDSSLNFKIQTREGSDWSALTTLAVPVPAEC